MGSLDRNLALSLHSGSSLLVEGEEVSLVFDDIDEFHDAVAYFIRHCLTVEVETGCEVQGFNNNTDKLVKGESVIRIKIRDETISEHVL